MDQFRDISSSTKGKQGKIASPTINHCSSACTLPLSSSTVQKLSPGDAAPVSPQNANPSLSSSFSPPINHPTMFKKRAANSTSTQPLLTTQRGPKSIICGLPAINPMMSNVQNGRWGRFSDNKKRQVGQHKKSVQETIVISDDEEKDDKESADGLDLTLRL